MKEDGRSPRIIRVKHTDAERERAREIGPRIRAARIDAGYNQETFGALVGGAVDRDPFSVRAVSQWENGERVPYSWLEEISVILGVDKGFLLHGKPEGDISQILREIQLLREEVRRLTAGFDAFLSVDGRKPA